MIRLTARRQEEPRSSTCARKAQKVSSAGKSRRRLLFPAAARGKNVAGIKAAKASWYWLSDRGEEASRRLFSSAESGVLPKSRRRKGWKKGVAKAMRQTYIYLP